MLRMKRASVRYRMEFLCHILCVCVVMLFSAFGANMAFVMPIAASDFSYPQAEIAHLAQADDVGFSACAPPLAAANVAVTDVWVWALDARDVGVMCGAGIVGGAAALVAANLPDIGSVPSRLW